MKVTLDKDITKIMAKNLHIYIKNHNPEFKLSNAYEAIALMFGFKNWNVLSAAIEEMK